MLWFGYRVSFLPPSRNPTLEIPCPLYDYYPPSRQRNEASPARPGPHYTNRLTETHESI